MGASEVKVTLRLMSIFPFYRQVTKVRHFEVIKRSSSLHKSQGPKRDPKWGSQKFASKPS